MKRMKCASCGIEFECTRFCSHLLPFRETCLCLKCQIRLQKNVVGEILELYGGLGADDEYIRRCFNLSREELKKLKVIETL